MDLNLDTAVRGTLEIHPIEPLRREVLNKHRGNVAMASDSSTATDLVLQQSLEASFLGTGLTRFNNPKPGRAPYRFCRVSGLYATRQSPQAVLISDVYLASRGTSVSNLEDASEIAISTCVAPVSEIWDVEGIPSAFRLYAPLTGDEYYRSNWGYGPSILLETLIKGCRLGECVGMSTVLTPVALMVYPNLTRETRLYRGRLFDAALSLSQAVASVASPLFELGRRLESQIVHSEVRHTNQWCYLGLRGEIRDPPHREYAHMSDGGYFIEEPLSVTRPIRLEPGVTLDECERQLDLIKSSHDFKRFNTVFNL